MLRRFTSMSCGRLRHHPCQSRRCSATAPTASTDSRSSREEGVPPGGWAAWCGFAICGGALGGWCVANSLVSTTTTTTTSSSSPPAATTPPNDLITIVKELEERLKRQAAQLCDLTTEVEILHNRLRILEKEKPSLEDVQRLLNELPIPHRGSTMDHCVVKVPILSDGSDGWSREFEVLGERFQLRSAKGTNNNNRAIYLHITSKAAWSGKYELTLIPMSPIPRVRRGNTHAEAEFMESREFWGGDVISEEYLQNHFYDMCSGTVLVRVDMEQMLYTK